MRCSVPSRRASPSVSRLAASSFVLSRSAPFGRHSGFIYFLCSSPSPVRGRVARLGLACPSPSRPLRSASLRSPLRGCVLQSQSECRISPAGFGLALGLRPRCSMKKRASPLNPFKGCLPLTIPTPPFIRMVAFGDTYAVGTPYRRGAESPSG